MSLLRIQVTIKMNFRTGNGLALRGSKRPYSMDWHSEAANHHIQWIGTLEAANDHIQWTGTLRQQTTIFNGLAL